MELETLISSWLLKPFRWDRLQPPPSFLCFLTIFDNRPTFSSQALLQPIFTITTFCSATRTRSRTIAMLRASLQAVRTSLKRQFQPLSTTSAPGSAMHASQAVRKSHAAQPSASKPDKFLDFKTCQKSTRTSNATDASQATKACISQGFSTQSTSTASKSSRTEVWNGLTVWAHLW